MFKIKTQLIKDTFCYSHKYKSALKTTISIIIAIFVSLLLSVIIGAAAGYNPGKLLANLFTMGFNDYKSLIVNITVLGIGALSFIFAFKTGLFNIGITGQMMTAGVVCLAISIALKDSNFPNGLSQIFMIVIAIISSTLIGSLISVLKVYLKVNEVISSILLNWIIYFSIRMIIAKYFNADPHNPLTTSVTFTQVFTLNANGFGWLAALIIFVVLAVVIFIVLKYTVFGIKITSVGKSISASKYLGYNTRLLSISSLSISAAIAGILGYVLYTANTDTSIPISEAVDMLPAEGMNGIAIGLISMSNPLVTIPIAAIMGLFQTSSQFLETGATQISNLIIGFIILGASLFSVIYSFKPWLKIQEWRIGKQFINHYKTYINDLDKLISKYKGKVFDVSKYYSYKNAPEKLNKIFDNSTIELFNQITSKKEYLEHLLNEYKFEKNKIISQFKKRVLIDKASKVFWFKLSIEKNKEKYLLELNQEYNRLLNNYNEKLINLTEKQNSLEFNSESYNKLANKISNLNLKIENLKNEYNSLVKKANEKYANKIKNPHIDSNKAQKTKQRAFKELSKIKYLEANEQILVEKWINDSYENLINQLSLRKEG